MVRICASRLMPVLLLVASAAPAQRFAAGVKGGVPVSGYLTGSGLAPAFSSKTNRYTLGPAVEVLLTRDFAVEANALYKRLHYDYRLSSFSASGTSFDIHGRATANRWEFPLLLKRRAVERLFVGGGISFAHATRPRQVERYCSRSLFDREWRCGDTSSAPALAFPRQTGIGFAATCGTELRRAFLRFAPEVRYTRWTRAPWPDPSNASSNGFGTNRNQVELLLGILF